MVVVVVVAVIAVIGVVTFVVAVVAVVVVVVVVVSVFVVVVLVVVVAVVVVVVFVVVFVPLPLLLAFSMRWSICPLIFQSIGPSVHEYLFLLSLPRTHCWPYRPCSSLISLIFFPFIAHSDVQDFVNV